MIEQIIEKITEDESTNKKSTVLESSSYFDPIVYKYVVTTAFENDIIASKSSNKAPNVHYKYTPIAKLNFIEREKNILLEKQQQNTVDSRPKVAPPLGRSIATATPNANSDPKSALQRFQTATSSSITPKIMTSARPATQTVSIEQVTSTHGGQ